MRESLPAPVAVLGPTNTGKTHLAVERMCAHSSGMMGFPLRLLAREVYDRVLALKGAASVALITGEEKIVPPQARWFLCTAESMPLDRDFAFVALDEAQLGIDPERGHVFTDRLLRARGREETMILGSDSLRPMVRALLPKAELIGRPRFSTLAYAGGAKLSRLPSRSVIVAFSAEQVYAAAEMLRRTRGGAAVVMGALSPRTRNAQVAMYQAGEVDYLVATDAIGMGLNMDVGHVAFAGLTKFDGRRQRRLTVAEMAQIAGRAGRHQRDGTFGTLSFGGATPEFTPEEIERIEEHRFAPLDFLYWRNGEPDFASLDALLASLELRPDRIELRPAPESVDLAVLRKLAQDAEVRARASHPDAVRRLWAACGLPDFRKTGPEHHARLVARIFADLTGPERYLSRPWVADQVARLDNVQGDIDALADRIAGVRTWAYIAHRADWLAEPEAMAERTRKVEEKLSDALHDRLTQRFVDKRTAVLLRDMGGGAADLPVAVAPEGEVTVAGHAIGRLDGFHFDVDPAARLADRKMLLAAAERRLGGEYEQRAARLIADADHAFTLASEAHAHAALLWHGHRVARFEPGKNLLSPRVVLDRTLDRLSPATRDGVAARLGQWLDAQIARHLAPLRAIGAHSHAARTPPQLRGILSLLADAGGVMPRALLAEALGGLDRSDRQMLRRLGIRIGALDLFAPALLKPEAMRWRAALSAIRDRAPLPELPKPSATVIAVPNNGQPQLAQLGFRAAGPQMIRIDLAERIAIHAHESRGAKDRPLLDPAFVTSLALLPEAATRLMRDIGFQRDAGPTGWKWKGRGRRPAPPRSDPNHAFAALAELRRG